MNLNLYVIDAFADRQFAGNPAAVVPLDEWLPIEIMQQIAAENNLSETAFLVKNPEGIYEIRWFSPFKEIDFCGHATLASAFVIFTANPLIEVIQFWAKAVGQVEVKKASNGLIEMAFPNREPVMLDDIPANLLQGLSHKPNAYLRNQQAYFVIFSTAEEVRSVEPDLEKLKTLAPYDVVVTAPGADGVDFVSRYFWPANGGVEDPVTGSIHAGLAPYWAKQLNKTELVALQASQRTGTLYCRVEGDIVYVAGNCVSYLQGIIAI